MGVEPVYVSVLCMKHLFVKKKSTLCKKTVRGINQVFFYLGSQFVGNHTICMLHALHFRGGLKLRD